MKVFIPVISFGRSGGFRVLSELASNLVSKGHEVIFISTTTNGVVSPYYPTSAQVSYVNNQGIIIDKNHQTSQPGFNNKLSLLKRLVQLNALRLAVNRYTSNRDTLLATYSLTAFVVYLSKSNPNKYYYVQAYEPEFFSRSLKGKLSSKLISFSYRLNLTRIVNSPIYYNFKNLKAQHLVFPGIDFRIFNSVGKNYKTNFDNEPIVLGCVGRVEEVKGTIYVIRAFDLLRKMGINCELHMAVFGNEKMIDNTIKATYPKNDLELAEFYRNIDILVAPGIAQFGAVHYPVIEAMACGTGVITTFYYPAHKDNAWLCAPESEISIVDQVKDIISNTENFREKCIRANNDVQHLSWVNVTDNLITILENKC
ncbi:MAG: hypothetical protein RLZZ65_478 [Bacteroidota bacterium]|jgi:glycosyltransferase involved in cell wall biosynthesis